MGGFEATPGFEGLVLERIVRPEVERAAADILTGARQRAPEAMMWSTRLDTRVRCSHVDAEGQLIPANLHYRLRKVVYIRKGPPYTSGHRGTNPEGGWQFVDGYDLALRPRDTALPIEQRINCRCVSVPFPGLLAASLHAGPAVAEGSRVRVTVATEFPRAAESEFGSSIDRPARFMRDALQDVARRYQR